MKFLRKFIPFFIKRMLHNYYARLRYKVSLSKGSRANRSVFGLYCLVGKNSEVVTSEIGRSTYIANDTTITFAKIGKFCAVGDNVKICLGNHPTEKIVGIHPCFYSLYGQGTPAYLNKQIFEQHKFVDPECKYVVEIGNDVWIGNNVSILDGVTIADGAVVGTGAVVTCDVEPYSIVVGVPAKHTRYRFNKEQREFLLKFRWWEKSDTWFHDNAQYFGDIENFVRYFSKETE
jgi:acetyltransferase-like isoleucine patch superfamily enzyme